MKVLYFTATGNSLFVAKQFGAETISIPKAMKSNSMVFSDDKIGIVFPCYVFGMPKLIAEFLKKVTIKSDYIFVVMTYGNLSFAGIDHFVKQAEKQTIKISYSNEILMTDNFLPFYKMESQLAKESSKNIPHNISLIVDDVKNNKKRLLKKPLWKKGVSAIAQTFYDVALGKKEKIFIIEESCNSCGVCEKVCPVDNIIVEKGNKPKFFNNCQFCMACPNLCPPRAIRLKNQRSGERFRNKNVSLDEIIYANSHNKSA